MLLLFGEVSRTVAVDCHLHITFVSTSSLTTFHSHHYILIFALIFYIHIYYHNVMLQLDRVASLPHQHLFYLNFTNVLFYFSGHYITI